MKVQVQKWGNSLALRIPKPLTVELHIEQGSTVDVTVRQGKLVISPAATPEFTLAELLAKVTRRNLHQEVDAGPAAGREVW
jgi:antitoxin MazE